MEHKTRKLDFNGINFELPERYEPIKIIGKGTYGAVVSATDNLTKEKVAIKKLSKIEDMVRISRFIANVEHGEIDRCETCIKRNNHNEELSP